MSIGSAISRAERGGAELLFWNLAWLVTSVVGGRPAWIVCGQITLFLVVLFARRSVFLEIVSLAAPFLWVAGRFPEVANHENLALGVGLFSLLGLAAGVPLARLLPALARWGLFGLYFWAFFHKLNWDFLNPSVSCANEFAGSILGRPAPWTLVPWIALTLEGLLAVAIVARPLRRLGFVVAFLLHGTLVFLGFANFACWIVLFFGAAFGGRRNIFGRTTTRALAIAVAALASWQSFAVSREGLPLEWALNIVVVLMVARVFWSLVRKGEDPETHFESAPSRRRGALMAVWIALLTVWGGSNYLGLRTAGTFSMFSNLSTEADLWNHLVVPRATKIFDYQDQIHWFDELPARARELGRDHPRPRAGSPDLEIARLHEDFGWWEALPRRSYSRFELLFLQFRAIPRRGAEGRLCRW